MVRAFTTSHLKDARLVLPAIRTDEQTGMVWLKFPRGLLVTATFLLMYGYSLSHR